VSTVTEISFLCDNAIAAALSMHGEAVRRASGFVRSRAAFVCDVKNSTRIDAFVDIAT
jgi:hypothetical protein